MLMRAADETVRDILVIGGGINGVGIARDAAGRGLTVTLCERDDLAQHTSSASTKLIHGGLRYLEYYDFALVRKALIEREILLRSAPHIIWPVRFVLPHQKGLRPAWLIRLGLFLYDHLGGRKLLPPTKVLKRGSSEKFKPLQDKFKLAFEYSDCWVDDARLVALNAMDARDKGADILTRHECIGLKRGDDSWIATLRMLDGSEKTVRARTIVNAAGTWVDDIIGLTQESNNAPTVRLVKGSHIVTRKLFDGDHAYFFQNADGRIIFAIPYEAGTRTLIGTTDESFSGNRSNVDISDDEITYLCEAASEYFAKPITRDDVVSTYSGIRPLFEDHADDASAVSRDYVLSYDDDGAPILSVIGGKITTYRELAERALKLIAPEFPDMQEPWTRDARLPGGDILNADFDAFHRQMSDKYRWLDHKILKRLARSYGTRLEILLEGAECVEDLGADYGQGLFQAEIDYLIEHEFIVTAQDALWRRSKLALHMNQQERAGVEAWFENRDKAGVSTPQTQRRSQA